MKKLFVLLIMLTGLAAACEEISLSEQARAYYSQNDIKKSFEVLLKIPENDRTAQDWLLLGNLLQDEGKTSEAVFMYKRAALVDNKFYRAYYNLGNIYLDEERPNLAIAEYKKALRIKYDFAYAYYNMGCAYVKTGDLKKAKRAFVRAVEYKNTEPSFFYNLAYVYKKSGKEKKAKEYLDLYNKAVGE